MRRSDEARIRYNVYLAVRQVKALESISQKTGAPVSELIRRSIDAYLKKGGKV